MWWEIIKMALNKNGSPSWSKINNLISMTQWANGGNSAKNTYKGAVTNDGMYGSYGG